MNIFIILLFFVNWASARIHTLITSDDSRKYFPLSTFGFYKGGVLDVSLKKFKSVPFKDSDIFGFSLDKTLRYVMNPYLDHHQDKCILENPIIPGEDSSSLGNGIYFIMDLENKLLKVTGKMLEAVKIFKNKKDLNANMNNNLYTNLKINGYASNHKCRSSFGDESVSIPLKVKEDYISVEFLVYIPCETSQGLYKLFFHNCPNYKVDGIVKIDLIYSGETTDEVELGSQIVDFFSSSYNRVDIEETNKGNYLSAGEMPLSALYFIMSLIFCLSGSFWIYILARSKHPVYKIHYLMAVLVYLKCLSLMFHGINFHFIQTNGEHVETWAILFYITYLLKGSVLFTVILLIGTGWTFIRRGDALSNKHKKIFMIVLPLQVLANIAKIIIDESEEGDIEQQTWWDVFILVDILCCGAIMFPVVWTIRHLQEASHTDGKAAMNLRKLKLFRHFYIMIVCYFYFTRIIVYILKITVPFQYEWLDEMFRETATLICFILTGYKFRPASANPYYQVPSEEDEVETCVVLSNENLAEGLKKVNRSETADRTISEETKRCLDYEL